MSVTNGQPANQTTFNDAFVSKTSDSTVIGEVTLANTDSGATVTNVQQAINDIKSDITDAENDISQLQSDLGVAESDIAQLETDLANHLADTDDAHAASAITNTPAGNLAATTVQAALDELQTDVDSRATSSALTDHINDTTAAHAASAVSFTPAGTIAATTAQLAIEEVATDAASALSSHESDTTSIHGISDTSLLVTTTGTQALTNKDFDGGTASDTSRITLPKASTSTLAGLTDKEGTIAYDTDLDNIVFNDGSDWVEVGSGTGGGGGSGEGGINYITNGNAEVDASGWTVSKNTSAGALPDSGFDTASTNITWTRDTTDYLRGTASFNLTKDAADRQGEQVYYDFTIDEADKARVLEIRFDYSVLSGTYADDDLIVYIYDVTNTAFIEPVSYKIKNAGVAVTHLATFQTAIDSTSYRLVIHVASASTDAYELLFDSIKVGPQQTNVGAPVTDWVSYTPTIANLGAGSATSSGWWRRIGDSMEVAMRVTKDGTNGTGSVAVSFSLPSGYSIDTAKLSSTTVQLLGHANNATSGHVGAVVYLTTTTVYLYSMTAAAGQWNGSAFTANAIINLLFRVPILGWSSNLALSNAESGRVVAVRATKAAGNHTANAATQDVTGWTTVFDSTGSFNATSGVFTAPEPGTYVVSGSVGFASNTTGVRGISIYKGSVVQSATGVTLGTATTYSHAYSETLSLLAGETIKIGAYQNSGGNLAYQTGETTINIFKISSGSQTIAASETVALQYTNTAGTSLANNATIPFATKVYDTHGAWVSDNTFKAPIAGLYSFKVSILFASAAFTALAKSILLKVNNSTSRYVGLIVPSTGYTNETGISGGVSLNLLAGDEVTFAAAHNESSARSLSTIGGTNYVCIERVGN